MFGLLSWVPHVIQSFPCDNIVCCVSRSVVSQASGATPESRNSPPTLSPPALIHAFEFMGVHFLGFPGQKYAISIIVLCFSGELPFSNRTEESQEIIYISMNICVLLIDTCMCTCICAWVWVFFEMCPLLFFMTSSSVLYILPEFYL